MGQVEGIPWRGRVLWRGMNEKVVGREAREWDRMALPTAAEWKRKEATSHKAFLWAKTAAQLRTKSHFNTSKESVKGTKHAWLIANINAFIMALIDGTFVYFDDILRAS